MKLLTKAEEEIMQIIWTLGSCTVGDIRKYIAEELGQKKPPHSTISSMVRILVQKGFLNSESFSATFKKYTPAINKETYSKQKIELLVSDYFGGSMNSLVSFLVKKKDLSLKELSELLEKLEEE